MRVAIIALGATALLLTPIIVTANSTAKSDKSFVVAQTDTQKKKKADNPPPPKGQSTY
jgi:hypothetical protein